MKNSDKEKWIAEVFDSMKDSKRAKPKPELFKKIEQQIDAQDVPEIPIHQWRMAVAATLMLLVLNVFAMRLYTVSRELNAEELVLEDASTQQLAPNFKIYE